MDTQESAAVAADPSEGAPRRRSEAKEYWKRFSRHPLAVVGLVVLILEIILVIVLPPLLDLDPYTSTSEFNAAPSSEHIFGTDEVGRDVFARCVYGGRISLAVGLLSTLVTLVIGIPLGVLAGYYRGKCEAIIMRAADIFMSFPSLVLTLVCVVVFGSSLWIIIAVIGVIGWPQVAKLVYSNVLAVKEEEYVESAVSLGLSDWQVITQYVLPNSISPVWATLPFRVSSGIMTEASLSFLGMGIQSPEASWGNMINGAQSYVVMTSRQWQWIPAGVLLVITIVATNLLGEGIRDAFDPQDD